MNTFTAREIEIHRFAFSLARCHVPPKRMKCVDTINWPMEILTSTFADSQVDERYCHIAPTREQTCLPLGRHCSVTGFARRPQKAA